jgi:hypothetical protein
MMNLPLPELGLQGFHGIPTSQQLTFSKESYERSNLVGIIMDCASDNIDGLSQLVYKAFD